jgi:hypothetical protein
MNEQQTKQHAEGERVIHERCLCCEVLDRVQDCLGVSPAVREHLANSRIEFLKAIREVIDHRITQLSSKGPQGTRVRVE